MISRNSILSLFTTGLVRPEWGSPPAGKVLTCIISRIDHLEWCQATVKFNHSKEADMNIPSLARLLFCICFFTVVSFQARAQSTFIAGEPIEIGEMEGYHEGPIVAVTDRGFVVIWSDDQFQVDGMPALGGVFLNPDGEELLPFFVGVPLAPGIIHPGGAVEWQGHVYISWYAWPSDSAQTSIGLTVIDAETGNLVNSAILSESPESEDWYALAPVATDRGILLPEMRFHSLLVRFISDSSLEGLETAVSIVDYPGYEDVDMGETHYFAEDIRCVVVGDVGLIAWIEASSTKSGASESSVNYAVVARRLDLSNPAEITLPGEKLVINDDLWGRFDLLVLEDAFLIIQKEKLTVDSPMNYYATEIPAEPAPMRDRGWIFQNDFWASSIRAVAFAGGVVIAEQASGFRLTLLDQNLAVQVPQTAVNASVPLDFQLVPRDDSLMIVGSAYTELEDRSRIIGHLVTVSEDAQDAENAPGCQTIATGRRDGSILAFLLQH
jgi:hypothetical protein